MRPELESILAEDEAWRERLDEAERRGAARVADVRRRARWEADADRRAREAALEAELEAIERDADRTIGERREALRRRLVEAGSASADRREEAIRTWTRIVVGEAGAAP